MLKLFKRKEYTMDIPQITKQETITKALREELENRPFDQISVIKVIVLDKHFIITSLLFLTVLSTYS